MKKVLLSLIVLLLLLYCSYASAGIISATNLVNSVNAWEGTSGYGGWCLKWVHDALVNSGAFDGTYPAGRAYGSAQQYWNSLVLAGCAHESSGNPRDIPLGADVFFSSPDGNGHIGIYTGNDCFISADDEVSTYHFWGETEHNYGDYWANAYYGWAWHDGVTVDNEAPVFISEEAIVSDSSIQGFTVTAKASDNIGIASATIKVWPTEEKSRAKEINGTYDVSTQTVTYVVNIENDVQYLDDSYGFACYIYDEAGNGPTVLAGGYPIGVYCLQCLAGDEYRAVEDVDIYIAPQYSFNGYSTKAFTQKAYSLWDQDTWVSYRVIGEMTIDGVRWYRLGRRMWAHADSFERIETFGEKLSDLWGGITRGTLFYVLSGDDASGGGSGWCVASSDTSIEIPGKQYTILSSISSPNFQSLAETYQSFVVEEAPDYAIQIITNNGQREIYITESMNTSGALDIPDNIGGIPVTGIGDSAFSNCTGVTSITIPETVCYIGHYAFDGCSNAAKLILPHNSTLYENNNANVGTDAFRGLTKLRELTLPVEWNQGSNYYNRFCMAGSENVEVIHYIKSSTGRMPDRDVSFTDYVEYFSRHSLKEIDFEEGITHVGSYAYSYYPGYADVEDTSWVLSKVTLPSTLESIGEYAFYGLSKLKTIEFPEGISDLGFAGFSKTSLESVELPEGLTVIPNGCFAGCGSLSEVIIPDSVERIEGGAFADCSALEVFPVTVTGNVSYIGDDAFERCTGLISVTIPESVNCIGNYAFNGCSNISTLVFPHNSALYEGITPNIGVYAFYGLTNLKELTLPVEWNQGSNYYNRFCMAGSENVEVIHYIKSSTGRMPDREVSFTDYVEYFSRHSLKEIDFEEGITHVGNYAYSYYPGYADVEDTSWVLSKVSLPSTLESIGEYAFYGLKELHTIELPVGLTDLGYAGFSKTGLRSVELPEGLKAIAYGCFSGCESLSEVIIPDSVERIEGGAFSDCSALEVFPVTITGNVSFIGDDAFERCTGLVSVVIPESVDFIGNYAFNGCSNISIMALPHNSSLYENNTNIGVYAFNGLTNLKEITLPVEWNQGSNYYNRFCIAGSDNVEVIHYIKSSTGRMPDREVSFTDYVEYFSRHSLKEIDFEEGITHVGNYAYSYYPGYADVEDTSWVLSKVTLPSTLESIGEYAFYGLLQLGTIQIPPTVNSIGVDAFGKHANGFVIYGNVGTTAEEYALDNQITFVSLSETIIASGTCGENAYWKLDTNGTLTVYGSGDISTRSFISREHRDKVKNVIVETGITGVGNYTFNGCGNLLTVQLPEGVTYIGGQAFEYCGELTSINIPASLKRIGAFAFAFCRKLNTLILPENVSTTVFTRMYEDILIEITLPSALEELQYGAFIEAVGVGQRINISIDFDVPEFVHTIDTEAFEGISASAVSVFTATNRTLEIKSKAFANCKHLQYFWIMGEGPEELHIADDAFAGCNGTMTIISGFIEDSLAEQLEQYALEHGFQYLENEKYWGNG